jgi:hypothetical protein
MEKGIRIPFKGGRRIKEAARQDFKTYKHACGW